MRLILADLMGAFTMRNNRRGFVFGGIAGLSALLAPNAAQACWGRRCRRSSAGFSAVAPPGMNPLPGFAPEIDLRGRHIHGALILPNTVHCPTWGGITIPSSALQPNTSYAFTSYGTGIYDAFVAGATFNPLIIDFANLSSVSWGRYSYLPVVQGTNGQPDAFTFNASYSVTQGSTPNSTGILTITVTLSFPYNNCGLGSWPNQRVSYS